MTDAATPIETVAADAQKALGAQMETVTRSFEGAAAFGNGSLEAVAKAAGAAMKAAEEMNAEAMSFSKKSVEESVAAAKEMAASKSLPELIEKQTDFAKSAFDGLFKQAARMNEMAMAASKEAMAPMAERLSAAVDAVKTPAS